MVSRLQSGRWRWDVVGIWAGIMGYATLRYHVFGGVAWQHLPVFTTNKAVSFASLALLAAAYLAREGGLRLRYGLSGFGLALLHVLMTLPIFNAQTYPKLYAANALNLSGELAVLAGCLSVAALCFPAAASLPSIKQALEQKVWIRWQRVGYLGILLAALHVVPIGWGGWWKADTWPAGMPPITLWSFLLALVPLVLFARRWLRDWTRRRT